VTDALTVTNRVQPGKKTHLTKKEVAGQNLVFSFSLSFPFPAPLTPNSEDNDVYTVMWSNVMLHDTLGHHFIWYPEL